MNFEEFKKKHDFAILIILTKKRYFFDIYSKNDSNLHFLFISCPLNVFEIYVSGIFIWEKTHHLGPLVVNVETKELFTMKKI